jgi:polar amino acid transport system substrate-binding protein
MRLAKLLGLFTAFALLGAACGGDDEGGELGLVSEGTLTVCTDVPYPPMEFEDPSGPAGYNGFDIQLMDAIADDLELELAVVTPGWEAITSGLAMETDQCDIATSSITITAEREEGVDFSEPYFTAEQSLLAPAGTSAQSGADLATIGVQSGTTGEIYVQDNFGAAEMVGFEDPGAMYLALDAGQVDGIVADLVANQGYIDDNPGVATIVETYATDEQYGMAVQEEGAEALLDAVNASLASLRDDGTYDTIFATWFSG